MRRPPFVRTAALRQAALRAERRQPALGVKCGMRACLATVGPRGRLPPSRSAAHLLQPGVDVALGIPVTVKVIPGVWVDAHARFDGVGDTLRG